MNRPKRLIGVQLLLAVGYATAAQAQAGAGSARNGQVIDAVHRSGAVPRCWNAYLRAEPDANSVRFRVRIDVGANGALAHVTVLDPTPVTLAACVQSELLRVVVPSGAAVTVETTYSFAAGAPAPVPDGPMAPR